MLGLRFAMLLVTAFCSSTLTNANCRVCPGGNGQIQRNARKRFTLSNGKTFTCSSLQRGVADVIVTPPRATQQDLHRCATAQVIAQHHCGCPGNNEFRDPNPACRLCQGGHLDSRSVPRSNYARLANTGVAGRMNCQGLEIAMAQGVFNANMCGTARRNAARTCCNFHI